MGGHLNILGATYHFMGGGGGGATYYVVGVQIIL